MYMCRYYAGLAGRDSPARESESERSDVGGRGGGGRERPYQNLAENKIPDEVIRWRSAGSELVRISTLTGSRRRHTRRRSVWPVAGGLRGGTCVGQGCAGLDSRL